MKKTVVMVLALVLIVAAMVFVCSACAKKEEAKEESVMMKITVENKTGEKVTSLELKELAGSEKQVWTTNSIMPDGTIEIGIDTVLENGAPKVDFSFAVESGNSYMERIDTKGDKVIVLKPAEDTGVTAEITTK